MSLLSCILLVLTLMACSAASQEKNIQEAKMMNSTDQSMARGSWFGIGSLIKQKIKNKKKLFTSIIGKKKGIESKRSLFGIGKQSLFGIGSLIKQKIQNKKKLIQQKIQNKKKFVSTIIGKKKSIKNKRAVLESAEFLGENTDASKIRGSWFGIGSIIKQKIQNKKKLIQQKIQNKKKFVSSIIGKKKSIKSKRSLFGIGIQSLFGMGSFIKQKIQNKKKLIQQKIQNKKKFVSTIIGKKKSIKNKRAVLESAESIGENTDASKTRGSWFGIGSIIKQKIQNKKKLVSSIIAKKKSIKKKGSLSYFRKF